MQLTHVRLLVDDVPAAVAFYRDVLGFEVRGDWGLRVLYVRDPARNLVELYENIPHDE